MGSETPGEKESKEKIKGYIELMETAYILFDEKYSMEYIQNLPYKQLIWLIDQEQSNTSKELQEIRAAHNAKKQMPQMR